MCALAIWPCCYDGSGWSGVGGGSQLPATPLLTAVSLAQHGGEDGDVEDDDDQQADDIHGHVRSLVVPDERFVEDEVVRLAESNVDVHQHRLIKRSSNVLAINTSVSSINVSKLVVDDIIDIARIASQSVSFVFHFKHAFKVANND